MNESRQESTAITLQLGPYESLGMMAWLMSHADYHSQWPLWSLENDILPPLCLGQYKLYVDDRKTPVGFVTWAWLDDSGKQRALNDEPLEEEDWRTGTHVMVNDFVAPWGHAREVVRDLKLNVFRQEKVFSIGRHADGRIRKIYHWRGVEYQEPVYRKGQTKKNSAGAATPAE